MKYEEYLKKVLDFIQNKNYQEHLKKIFKIK